MSDAIAIRDLHATYHDGTKALHGLSLSVAAGERLALLGPNGSGKTTLMLAIMGGVHTHGEIRIAGQSLDRKHRDDIHRRCGMVFQQSEDQLFMPRLLEDVAFGPMNHGLGAEEAEAVARKALAEVGLAGLEDKAGHHLSGGQMRAAALATVLAMNVEILLLDEPTGGLDVRSQRRMTDLLAARTETLLLSTHDLSLAETLCTRGIILDAGKLVADGPLTDLLADKPLLEKHGLV